MPKLPDASVGRRVHRELARCACEPRAREEMDGVATTRRRAARESGSAAGPGGAHDASPDAPLGDSVVHANDEAKHRDACLMFRLSGVSQDVWREGQPGSGAFEPYAYTPKI